MTLQERLRRMVAMYPLPHDAQEAVMEADREIGALTAQRDFWKGASDTKQEQIDAGCPHCEAVKAAGGYATPREAGARAKIIMQMIHAKAEAGFPPTAKFFDEVWPVALAAYRASRPPPPLTDEDFEDPPELTDEALTRGVYRIGGVPVDEETGKAAMREALRSPDAEIEEAARFFARHSGHADPTANDYRAVAKAYWWQINREK